VSDFAEPSHFPPLPGPAARALRSLGTRGPEFKSRRPDREKALLEGLFSIRVLERWLVGSVQSLPIPLQGAGVEGVERTALVVDDLQRRMAEIEQELGLGEG
jgi:hypothetical protein